MHKPSLGFSCSCSSSTPTAWVFSPEISSLRPFCQQTILSAHHLWVFPPSASPIRPPRGFSPWNFSLYAHFASKPYSPHIISGFFQLSPQLHTHHVGFLPGKLLSTPISPTKVSSQPCNLTRNSLYYIREPHIFETYYDLDIYSSISIWQYTYVWNLEVLDVLYIPSNV